MGNFVYSGGLSGGLLRHIKNDFFSLFQNEVKSVLNIKESYSMKKKPKKCSKKFASSFIKRRGGGAKAVYKLYKKTGNLVSDRIPKFSDITFFTTDIVCTKWGLSIRGENHQCVCKQSVLLEMG